MSLDRTANLKIEAPKNAGQLPIRLTLDARNLGSWAPPGFRRRFSPQELKLTP